MPWIVLFDGECGLCSRSVRLLGRLDRRGVLWFAPLQGETARTLGVTAPGHRDGTVVVVREDGGTVRRFERGDAVLELAEVLGWPWRALQVLRLVPRRLRDLAYDFVARRRRDWFGAAAACTPPARGGTAPRLLP